jgi:hypothetical protein
VLLSGSPDLIWLMVATCVAATIVGWIIALTLDALWPL